MQLDLRYHDHAPPPAEVGIATPRTVHAPPRPHGAVSDGSSPAPDATVARRCTIRAAHKGVSSAVHATGQWRGTST